MIFYLPRRRNGLRLAPSIALCVALGTQAALAQSPLSLERAVAAATGRSQLVIAADAQAAEAKFGNGK